MLLGAGSGVATGARAWQIAFQTDDATRFPLGTTRKVAGTAHQESLRAEKMYSEAFTWVSTSHPFIVVL